MSQMKWGIVGLPNVGKSTLFNALTANEAEASNYPFCTIDPNVGIVEVPDPRLAVLSKISNSQQIIPATVQFVDIAGLVQGAADGEGLGNKFLSHIAQTDAIVHVVRCFGGDEVMHVSGSVDPIRDIEVITTELVLADLQLVSNARTRVEKQMKGRKELAAVFEALGKVQAHLDAGHVARSLELDEDEWALLDAYPLITKKKVIYAANVSEDDLPEMHNDYVQQVMDYAAKEGNEVIPICAQLEAEIAQLDEEECRDFLAGVGLEESGLNRLIQTAFKLLGLITFLTTGEQETRAWTIKDGDLAPEAAGKIHTDIQKGFIRAEVITFEDMESYGGRNEARKAGKVRAEGKEYLVKDGDVILFLHN